jgi:hypothetical protein
MQGLLTVNAFSDAEGLIRVRLFCIVKVRSLLEAAGSAVDHIHSLYRRHDPRDFSIACMYIAAGS